jgi:hypothetical protein
MSLLFLRSGRVEIATEGDSVSLNGLRFEFSVRKTRSSTPNSVSVRVYNPAPSSRALAIEKKADVRVFGGYALNARLVTDANIVRAITKWEPPNVVLEIEALEGIRVVKEKTISISHANRSTVRQVIDEIAGQLEVDVREIDFDVSQPLRGGFSHVGKPGRALDDLVRRFKGSWSFQNTDLAFLPEEGYIESDDVPLITPVSGMLFSPEALGKTTSTDADENEETKSGWRVTSLMRPEIGPGDKVQIESRTASGEYVVDEVEHKGDLNGQEWYSVFTLVEPE